MHLFQKICISGRVKGLHCLGLSHVEVVSIVEPVQKITLSTKGIPEKWTLNANLS